MRLTWKLLVVVVLATLAILVIRAWNGESADLSPEDSKPVMSPEETRRLVEQALNQPRETVRFRFEPSPAETHEAPPLPPPSFAAVPPPPAPPTPAPTTSSEPDPTLMERDRENAVRKLQEAFARLSKLPRPLAPTAPAPPGAAAVPAPPTPLPAQ